MYNTEFTTVSSLFMEITTTDKIKELADIKTRTILEALNGSGFSSVFSYENSLVSYGLAELGYKVSVCGDPLFDHPNIKYIEKPESSYDLVLALDQSTTFCETNQGQQDLVKFLSSITSGTLVTTVTDYKNGMSNKLFEEPFYLKSQDNESIILTHRKWNSQDKQQWDHYTYFINNEKELNTSGPYKRRTMYFKQLAKFLFDNNVKNYKVHKEPLYKGVFSKTFQHIVTAEF